MGYRKYRNTTKGSWAFGASWNSDLGEFTIHFAVWHFGWCFPSKAKL